MKNREAILSREFTRPPFHGLRRITLGLLDICRSIGIGATLPPNTPPDKRPKDPQHDNALLAFVLDQSQPLDTIRARAAEGREAMLYATEDYRYNLVPAFLALAQEELRFTVEGMAAADYHTEPKPGDEEQSPPGKS